MDFGALLHAAQKNSEQSKTSGGKYYSTKYSAPKKEAKEKTLSDNIKKFLAKKEKEQLEKAQEDKEKRQKLLSLRDEKSKNKIRKMLKVIKSANKSVLQDAIDTENTAVTLHGPDQPDEDDYGYVSNEAAAAYKKYMEKIKAKPEENKFAPSRPTSRTDLSGTKNRVKVAIEREQIEKSTTGKSRTSKHVPNSAPTTSPLSYSPLSSSQKRNDSYDPQIDKEEEGKKRKDEQKKPRSDRAPSNPLGFQALLELAAIKQHQPIEIPVETKKKTAERLLTQKEKREMEEHQKYLEEREKRKRESLSSNNKNCIEGNDKNLNSRKQPSVTMPSKKPLPNAQRSESKPHSSSAKVVPKKKPNGVQPSVPRPINNNTISSNTQGTKVLSEPKNSMVQSKAKVKPSCVNGKKSTGIEKVSHASSVTNSANLPAPKSGGARSSSTFTKPINTSHESSSSTSSRQGSLKSIAGNTEQKTQSLNSKHSKDSTFPPPGMQRARQPKLQNRLNPNANISKPMKKAPKRRIYDEDEDEHDSEMDDFIDDGYEDGQNYSSYIKEIFGYDKSKYRDMDEDDAMESSFAQQMREEYVSKKIGIMEDLEDMRQEAEEKKKKVLMKKKKLK